MASKNSAPPGLHRNHRQRLKNRYLREGLAGFEPHNILELLLFYTIPQKDTNELAHLLLNRFGSLFGVFDAPVAELVKVPGIGLHTATLIRLIPDLWSAYERDRSRTPRQKVNSTARAAEILAPHFIGRTTEAVFAMAMDSSGGLIGTQLVAEGSPGRALIDVRRICEWAIEVRAANIVLAHNHPGSNHCYPSGDDCNATARVAAILKGLDVCLQDHLIFCGGEYLSMADNVAFAACLDGRQTRELTIQKRLIIKKIPPLSRGD